MTSDRVVRLEAVRRILPGLEATGSLPCPARKGAGIARDRCVELQRESGCACFAGDAAMVAWREKGRRDRTLGQKLAAVRAAEKAGTSVPWKLKCAWCGCSFEAKRGYHRKPRFHSEECRRKSQAERYARRARERRAKNKRLRLAHAS